MVHRNKFYTRTAHPLVTSSVSKQPVAPCGPTPEPYAAAAPLGPAARSRMRGADSLAQALDLLAFRHRIVADRGFDLHSGFILWT